ncbi:hypothetical protein PCE1_001141 [Barthelona sp. PCE]
MDIPTKASMTTEDQGPPAPVNTEETPVDSRPKFKRKKKNSRSKRSRSSRSSRIQPEMLSKLENEVFESYYKEQLNLSEEEHTKLFSTFRTPLYDSLRFDCEVTHEEFKNNWLPKLLAEEWPENTTKPYVIDKVGENVYGYLLPHFIMRKNPVFKSFHSWLVLSFNKGSVARQEIVSMVPPFFLPAEPGDAVLDMCAAPGSKTMQLMMKIGQEGVVMANEVNTKRCNVLHHQMSRLKKKAMLVVQHDARSLPPFHDGSEIGFDHILADVPCSGDGTCRKNPDVWNKWEPNGGLALHTLQLDIVRKGLRMLRVGGTIVYSTCSMNPMENEAVVATLLQDPGLELVDVSHILPSFERSPGITEWRVQMADKKGNTMWVDDYETVEKVLEFFRESERPEPGHEHVPVSNLSEFANDLANVGKREYVFQFLRKLRDIVGKHPTLFPPQNINDINIDRCCRFYPHVNDSGAFFVACLRKVGPLADESKKTIHDIEVSAPKSYDGFLDSLEPIDEETRTSIIQSIGLSEDCNLNLVERVSRACTRPERRQHLKDGTKPSAKHTGNFFSVSDRVYGFLSHNIARRYSMIGAGVCVAKRSKEGPRAAYEGLHLLKDHITEKKIMELTHEEMCALVSNVNTDGATVNTDENFAKWREMLLGNYISRCVFKEREIIVPVRKGHYSVDIYVSKSDLPDLTSFLEIQSFVDARAQYRKLQPEIEEGMVPVETQNDSTEPKQEE